MTEVVARKVVDVVSVEVGRMPTPASPVLLVVTVEVEMEAIDASRENVTIAPDTGAPVTLSRTFALAV